MEQEFIDTANKEGTRRNIRSRKNWYLQFCEYGNLRAFPTNEFKICKFASYLSNTMKTVESIKSYCTTICQEHELRGFKPIRRGIRYYKTIDGICNKLSGKESGTNDSGAA